MNKKMAAACIGFCLMAGMSSAQEKLLRNGSFESETLGQLSFWQIDAYQNTDEARRVFTVESPSRTGKRSVAIVNLVPNDTRVVQWLAVEPATYYRITCWVMAENVAGGNIGATIAIQGSITPSADVKDTGDVWKKLELVGKTGPDQTALAVGLRLGFYDNLVTGRAYFDEADAVKLTAAPAGVTVVDFSSNRGTGLIRYQTETTKTPTQSQPELPWLLKVILLAAAGAILLGGLFLSILVSRRRSRKKVRDEKPRPRAAVNPATASVIERAVRKSLHISVIVRKKLSGEGFKLIELKSVNLSATGMLLSSDDLSLLSVGEQVELTAVYKRKKYILGAAQVVRKQEIHQGTTLSVRSGFGINFLDSSAPVKKNITLLLG